MLRIRTILHPTDFYTHSDWAFRLACSLARDHQAPLILVHVLTPPLLITPDEAMAETGSWEHKERLREALRQLRPGPEVAVEHRLLEGEPAPEILRAAEENAADLIVIGTHGRRGVERMLLGSVAEQVLRKASCPVLTVKAPV